MRRELDYNVSIRAAIIFLNTFGLTLEEKYILNDGDNINIYDNEKNVVGSVILNGSVIKMKAKSNYGILNASYETGSMIGFIDLESKCEKPPKYVEWSNNISYKIYNDKNLLMKGNFSIRISADEEFGVKCSVHPSFIYFPNDGGMLEAKFQTDGKVFYLEYKKDDLSEKIELTPYCDTYFLHQITKGKFEHSWPYIRFYSLRNGAVSGLNDAFETLFVESINGKVTNKEFKTEKKIAEEYDVSKSQELLNQKAFLTQGIGSEAFNRIQNIIKFFIVNDNSLIDNFLSVSLNSYSDSQIKGFLGIERKRFMFQNGTDNLEEAYFGQNKNRLLDWNFIDEDNIKNVTPFIKK